MKDEIKEINIKMPGQILDYVDTKEHLLELFNYITNLHQLEQDHQKLNGELREENKKLQEEIEKAVEIYKNRNTCKYKKERFMKDKSTSDLMYETLMGGDKDVKD